MENSFTLKPESPTTRLRERIIQIHIKTNCEHPKDPIIKIIRKKCEKILLRCWTQPEEMTLAEINAGFDFVDYFAEFARNQK